MYLNSTTLVKQDSKELSTRPLENAPKTFNSKKKLFKLLMLKDSLASNTNNAPKTFKIGYQSLKIL
jgi:hypothetical protein